jgi:hypothetical protein
MVLTLQPDGNADFLNSGDIINSGTYHFKGGKLILTVNKKEFKFDIVSDTELRYEHTRVLKLY